MNNGDLKPENNEKGIEYIGSVVRVVNFIDNFTDFMYHSIEEIINNIPEGIDKGRVDTFLTSLRKEIADFQSDVSTLRHTFDI